MDIKTMVDGLTPDPTTADLEGQLYDLADKWYSDNSSLFALDRIYGIDAFSAIYSLVRQANKVRPSPTPTGYPIQRQFHGNS